MTHLWIEPMEIKVEASRAGLPVAFRWTGRPYEVSQIANRWRVHTHWWREEIRREYFKVVTDSRLLCTLYHDLLADHWYLERVYD
jgi:hypothetical protein